MTYQQANADRIRQIEAARRAEDPVVWVVCFRPTQRGPGPCVWVEEGPALPARRADLHPWPPSEGGLMWGAVQCRLAGPGDRRLAGWTGGAYRLHGGRPYPPAPSYRA